LFKDILRQDGILKGEILEVGSGRGTISSYFAHDGFNCHLLDSSPDALKTARSIFAQNNHQATYSVGDADQLPFPENQFDVVLSIGLLEHFDNIEPCIREQMRVLESEGRFIAYIRPKQPNNVQKHFSGINKILKIFADILGWESKEADLYRTDFRSNEYVPIIKKHGGIDIKSMGVQPIPEISHSPEFPFSLMPHPAELIVTRLFEAGLWARKQLVNSDPWVCREEFGQAFVITCREKIHDK
jgi:2-polyprenyl-3-methyl-5-hydroxy-6-metoxy-1,4-benzoquinol methylase